MLSENIRARRKSKGLSQQELAVKLNVVRQTVSKWESGLSVPDADLLIALSDALEMPVSELLGETVEQTETNSLAAIAEKLEVVNLQLAQLAQRRTVGRRLAHRLLIVLCVLLAVGFAVLYLYGSAYLTWDYGNPETAVLGTAAHMAEWLFVRLAPFAMIAAAVGAYATREKP